MSAIKLIPAKDNDIIKAHTEARNAFLERLNDKYPDPTDADRQQVMVTYCAMVAARCYRVGKLIKEKDMTCNAELHGITCARSRECDEVLADAYAAIIWLRREVDRAGLRLDAPDAIASTIQVACRTPSRSRDTVRDEAIDTIIDWWRGANEAPGGCSPREAIDGMEAAVKMLYRIREGKDE